MPGDTDRPADKKPDGILAVVLGRDGSCSSDDGRGTDADPGVCNAGALSTSGDRKPSFRLEPSSAPGTWALIAGVVGVLPEADARARRERPLLVGKSVSTLRSNEVPKKVPPSACLLNKLIESNFCWRSRSSRDGNSGCLSNSSASARPLLT